MNRQWSLISLSLVLVSTNIFAVTFQVGQPDSTKFYGSFRGFGAEWDPFFWNTNNRNRGCDSADWIVITNRLKDVNVGIARMMMHNSAMTGNKDSLTTSDALTLFLSRDENASGLSSQTFKFIGQMSGDSAAKFRRGTRWRMAMISDKRFVSGG